jgi:hypothetical protein
MIFIFSMVKVFNSLYLLVLWDRGFEGGTVERKRGEKVEDMIGGGKKNSDKDGSSPSRTGNLVEKDKSQKKVPNPSDNGGITPSISIERPKEGQ